MKIKTSGLIIFLIPFIWSCSNDQPYERLIAKQFEELTKVAPTINEIKVDTTATMESYAEHWKNSTVKLKDHYKKYYEKKYLEDKETYEERAKQNEERSEKLRIKNTDVFGADSCFKSMTESKNKLDSAEKGLYNSCQIGMYERFSQEKSTLHQVTVKYTLGKGATGILQFVIEELPDDTTAYRTNESLDKFIKESLWLRRQSLK